MAPSVVNVTQLSVGILGLPVQGYLIVVRLEYLMTACNKSGKAGPWKKGDRASHNATHTGLKVRKKKYFLGIWFFQFASV